MWGKPDAEVVLSSQREFSPREREGRVEGYGAFESRCGSGCVPGASVERPQVRIVGSQVLGGPFRELLALAGLQRYAEGQRHLSATSAWTLKTSVSSASKGSCHWVEAVGHMD